MILHTSDELWLYELNENISEFVVADEPRELFSFLLLIGLM